MIKVGSGERINGVQQNGNNLLVLDLWREKRSGVRSGARIPEGGLFDKMKFVDVVITAVTCAFQVSRSSRTHMNHATPTAPPTTATASTPHLRLSTPAAPVWSPGFDDCVPVAGGCCPAVSVSVALAPTYA